MIIIIILVDRETGKASTQILWFPVKSVKNRILQTVQVPERAQQRSPVQVRRGPAAVRGSELHKCH